MTPPENVDLRDGRFEPRNRAIYLRESGSETGVLSWLPAARGVTNRRVELLQKVFAAKGITAEPTQVLAGLWKHLTDADGVWDGTVVSESVGKFGAVRRLAWDRLEFRLLSDDHRPGRCDRCRRVFWRSLAGTCPGWRCEGTVRPVDDLDELRSDHYARLFMDIEPVAMAVQEHTAMWTSDKAARLQEEFVRGRVNTLSCSTTFELGVDVGEVQAVLLRNVPPTPANYVQRAGSEPPHALPGPRRDRPEAPQRRVPAPGDSDAVEVAEVELDLLARIGVDRDRHRSRRPEPRAPHLPDRSHDGRIRTGVTLSAQLVEHRHRQQPWMRGQQRLNACTPTSRHHPPLIRHLHPCRRSAGLEPLRDRRRMKAELLGDLPVRPALVLERVKIHVLLLVHHEPGGPFGSVSLLGRSTR